MYIRYPAVCFAAAGALKEKDLPSKILDFPTLFSGKFLCKIVPLLTSKYRQKYILTMQITRKNQMMIECITGMIY